MKFYTTDAIGDSGLFYLGYWINKQFNYPFRVMSADIGIDAEIEITDETLHSKGLIVKAQVKSTETAILSNFSEYIDKPHLDYWNKITIPVIYFKVDLSRLEIYYKVISSMDDIEKTRSNDENKWRINFDLQRDKLKNSSKLEWENRFRLVEFHNINTYFDKVETILDKIIVNVLDDESYTEEMEKLNLADKLSQKLNSLKELYPWKFGQGMTARLFEIELKISNFRNNLIHHINIVNYGS